MNKNVETFKGRLVRQQSLVCPRCLISLIVEEAIGSGYQDGITRFKCRYCGYIEELL